MKITAAVTREKGTYTVETVELAEPKANEVLIKMVACGICHTDFAVIEQFLPIQYPYVAGHEGVGIVEKVGDAVEDLAIGDRVTISFPSCGKCDACFEGKPWACVDGFECLFGGNYRDGTKRMVGEDGVEIGVMFGQGSFATYTIADQSNTVKLDVGSDKELAELCSLGCGIQTGAGAVLNRMQPRPGKSLAVFGCGTVGLAGIMGAKIAGCNPIIAIDIAPARLEMAKQLGATHIINGKDPDVEAQVRAITGGKGLNFALEAAGNPMVTITMLDCMAREGMAVLVSVTGPQEAPIVLEKHIMNPSVTVAGAVEGCSNPKVFIPELVRFYKEGRLPVDKLNKFYDFKDIDQALKDCADGTAIKPILMF